MPEPYEALIAIAKIRSILRDGRFSILPHYYRRMIKRNVGEEDILEVLNENGTISKPPEFYDNHQKWKYTVDGYDIENDKLSVVVNIVAEDWIVVTITVF